MNTDNEHLNLEQFTGTEQYHSYGRLSLTDGIAYLGKEAGAFWIVDIVTSVQHLAKIIQSRHFMVWRIVRKDKGCTVSAYSDSNEDGSFSREDRKSVV